jgi:hypothetical protein
VDWAAEGYQLWMAVEENAMSAARTSSMKQTPKEDVSTGVNAKASRSGSLAEICLSAGLFAIIPFVKSSLTVNPSMSQVEHLYLQGEDRLLINFSGESLVSNGVGRGSSSGGGFGASSKGSSSKNKCSEIIAPLGNSKNWVVVPVPSTYLATNWPMRVSFLITFLLTAAVCQLTMS